MEHFSEFFPAICAGLGLFLAGAANLVLWRRGVALRAVATVVGLGISLVVAARLQSAEALGNTARLLAIAVIPFVLLGNEYVLRALTTVVAVAGRPVLRSALLTAAGIGLAIGSVVVFERADQRSLDDNLAELELFDAKIPSTPSTSEKATTDRGTPIEIAESTGPRAAEQINNLEARLIARSFRESVIRVGPADDRSNCHGWVFTGGRYLVRGKEVEVILSENNYRQKSTPQSGDLVIYRTAGGPITHTAVVQYAAEGDSVLVRSKWGNLGIFTHAVDQSTYGTEFNYYRSPRGGHLLSISPISSGHSVPPATTE